MPLDPQRLEKCFQKLLKLARARFSQRADIRITYGRLARHLGVANQSVGQYLTAIYCREVEGKPEVPDLTTLVVAGTGKGAGRYGRFNSRSGPARSIAVDSDNSEDVKLYEEELRRVDEYWGRK